MARIKDTTKYVFDAVPEASSFLVGSDEGDARITKSYRIDTVFGLLPDYGYFTDAPNDGQPYYRQDETWVIVPPGGSPGNVNSVFGRTGAVTAQVGDYSAFYAPLAHTHLIADITDANDADWDAAFGWGNHAGLYVDVSTNQTGIAGEKTWTGAFHKFTGRVGVGEDVFGAGRLGDSLLQATSIDTTSINLKDTGQATALAVFATPVGGSDGYVTSMKNFVDDVNVISIAGVGTSTYNGVAREAEATLGLRNDFTAGQFRVFDTFNNDYDAATPVSEAQGWVAIHGGGATAKKVGLWRYNGVTYNNIWELDSSDVLTYTVDINVPTEAYGVAWSGSTEVPTKGDLYTEIEAVAAGGVISFNTRTGAVVPLSGDYSAFYAALSHTHLKADITDFSVDIGDINAAGTPSVSTYLRGDGSWAGIPTTLGSLSDVTLITPATGEALMYNGTLWVNRVLVEADISDLGTAVLLKSGGVMTGNINGGGFELQNFTRLDLRNTLYAGTDTLTLDFDSIDLYSQSVFGGSQLQYTISGDEWRIDNSKIITASTGSFTGTLTTTGSISAPTGTLSALSGSVANAFEVGDDPYGVGWNGSIEVPTKNAIYDKIETLGTASALNDLSDVTITTAANNDYLHYNGSAWVNKRFLPEFPEDLVEVSSGSYDDARSTGLFNYQAAMTGSPDGGASIVMHLERSTASQRAQMAFPHTSQDLHYRVYNASVWGAWRQVWTDNDFALTDYVAVTGDTMTGELTAPSLRLTNVDDVALASTLHAFQIGPTSGNNIAMDGNELMARSNGTAGTLFLQSDGGAVNIGNAVSTSLTVSGTIFSTGNELDITGTSPRIDFHETGGLNNWNIIVDADNMDFRRLGTGTTMARLDNAGFEAFGTLQATSTISGPTVVGLGTGNNIRNYGSGTGTANVAYNSYYESNGSTRQGYIGFGSGANSDFTMYNDVSTTYMYLDQAGGTDGLKYNYSATTHTVFHEGNIETLHKTHLFETSNTSNTDSTEWTKFARITLDSQFEDAAAIIHAISGGTSAADPRVTELHIRAKQQAAFGSDPVVHAEAYHYDGAAVIEIGYVIVQNTPTTIVEFYLQNNTTFSRIYGNAAQIYDPGNNRFTWYDNQVYAPTVTGLVDKARRKLIWQDSAGDAIVTGEFDFDGFTLRNSTDRPGLIEMSHPTSYAWYGYQIKDESGQLWSIMGDDNNLGLYDDTNSKWIMLHTENAGLTLYYNAAAKLVTTNTGITVTGTGVATDWDTTSDRRLKTGDREIEPVGRINWLMYEKEGKTELGAIAQEVQEYAPYIVREDDTEDKMLSMSYRQLQILENVQLRKELDEANARLDRLELIIKDFL